RRGRTKKKLRMDLDSVDRVAVSGDVEANNAGETGPVNNNTQRGDGRESASSDIEPRNNSLQGEGKLEANEGSFESQVQIMHELTQNVETDNNRPNQSNHSKETPEPVKIVEQVFSENNLYIDEVDKDSRNETTKENRDNNMENECLSQPEESNLEDLIEAEKNIDENRLSEVSSMKEDQFDELMQEAESVEENDSNTRQVITEDSNQNMDKDGFITITHKKKVKNQEYKNRCSLEKVSTL
ncbi:10865_t:CDS:2, partial [Gigaspora rosea]